MIEPKLMSSPEVLSSATSLSIPSSSSSSSEDDGELVQTVTTTTPDEKKSMHYESGELTAEQA